jgi:phosphoglycolate phosphatase
MIRGVVFDKDGTLFDFRKAWGPWVERVVRDLAVDEDQAVAMGRAIGFDLPTHSFAPDSPVIAATVRDSARILLDFLPGRELDELSDALDAASMEVTLVETVPLVAFLEGLRDQGIKVGLATNDTEEPAREHLARFGVLHLFDFVAGYDSGFGGKPGPGMLNAFLAHTGLAADQVAMVGDSRHDLTAGRAAGMACVGVLTGIAKEGELSPHADVVLADIGALPGWINEQAA